LEKTQRAQRREGHKGVIFMDENELSGVVIGAAIEVHKALGPGLLESVYQRCLLKELHIRGVWVESEVPVTVEYKGDVITEAYRVDLLVNNKLVVELKAVDQLTAVHKAQLLTYLRLMNKKLGLLINFNELVVRKGIRRLINNY
jgi:GxxExxY protein